jgi:hypothetical protein
VSHSFFQKESEVSQFIDQVRTLQWDDHRYYHQSRINQTLHLISAVSFLVAYGLLLSALAFETAISFFIRGPSWGLAWAAKILLDPFHNVAIYWRSPMALIHGEMLDPINGEVKN